MRRARLVVLAALFLTLPARAEQISREEYRSRRAALRKALSDGVTVLFGWTEKDAERSRTAFVQEPNFQYLTGWREPGAVLIVSSASEGEDVLFLPSRDPKREQYSGRKAAAEDTDVRRVTGFERVLPIEKLETELSRMLERHAKVYTLFGTGSEEKLRSLAPLREVADGRETIARLRLKKSRAEIVMIQRSTDVTVAAQRAAWKRAAPGSYEYQPSAAFTGAVLENGCGRNAYAPIFASGPNAVVLHYADNSRQMDGGELLLIDAGAECAGYAADITRTIPVGGKFTARQRQLYEIVLGAQRAVIAAVKPGMTFERGADNGLTQIALDYINSKGKSRDGKPLGEYFTHKVGHHVGLEVHDAGMLLTYGPVEAGMVITVEPGLYIPEENIGIRIEDMLLVTENGAKVLSGALPTEPAEIEKALSR